MKTLWTLDNNFFILKCSSLPRYICFKLKCSAKAKQQASNRSKTSWEGVWKKHLQTLPISLKKNKKQQHRNSKFVPCTDTMLPIRPGILFSGTTNFFFCPKFMVYWLWKPVLDVLEKLSQTLKSIEIKVKWVI